jgi:hypothetical protein
MIVTCQESIRKTISTITKLKFALYPTMNAHKGSTAIAVLLYSYSCTLSLTSAIDGVGG